MEQANHEKYLEVFKANFKQGLTEILDSAEILLDIPRPPDPFSMGFDDRTIDDLTPYEREAVKEIIYQSLGLDPAKMGQTRLREYTTPTPNDAKIPGEIQVGVYRTNNQAVFLQELTFSDGEKRWLIGPDQNI